MQKTLGLVVALLLVGTACANDPVYLFPTPTSLEINSPAGPTALVSSLVIPVMVETPAQLMLRTELAMELGLMPDQVPQVRRDAMDVSLEWTVKNLSQAMGRAQIQVIAANEYFLYDPNAFVIDPLEDAPAPPLLGGVPILVPPGGHVSGVMSEADLAEAALDLDAITRAGITPEYAILRKSTSDDIEGVVGSVLPAIPAEAVAAILQVDLSFTGNVHMVLEFVVRVRDRSDRLITNPTDAVVPGAIVPPSIIGYVPPPPPMMGN